MVISKVGMKVLAEEHPDVHIHAASVDDDLNENGTMDPGVGDVGDRLFGTGTSSAVPPISPDFFRGNLSASSGKTSPISFEAKKKRKIEQ